MVFSASTTKKRPPQAEFWKLLFCETEARQKFSFEDPQKNFGDDVCTNDANFE